ncbi:sigma-70 family RNA polymerase sigma factor [Parasalinivibrio latis]|uniref:sigma-70 family RNA polymerase sigma factor n=1 Tax=Parasalinivibrio latis TaxID=2952610 RepID=UPI0030E0A884
MTKPDGELLTKLLIEVADNQSRKAFESLFSYFAPKIRSYGIRTLHQEALAMELVQDTMILVWRKAALFNRDKGAATTWIFTIMRNVSFDMLRKIQSNREDNISSDIWPMFEEDAERFDEQAAKDQLHGNLMAYIDELPDLQQQVVRGVYLKQLTHQELAEQLKIPLGTVKSRLRLGLQKLRHHLEKHHD